MIVCFNNCHFSPSLALSLSSSLSPSLSRSLSLPPSLSLSRRRTIFFSPTALPYAVNFFLSLSSYVSLSLGVEEEFFVEVRYYGRHHVVIESILGHSSAATSARARRSEEGNVGNDLLVVSKPIAPSNKIFISYLFPMSGTLSAHMLIAMLQFSHPSPFTPLQSNPLDGENPLFLADERF